MIEKMVKVRKIHLCGECGDEIPIGDNALFLKMKQPRFGNKEDYDIQVGIEYYTAYFCKKCLKRWE